MPYVIASVALLGFRMSGWIIVAGLAAHGVFDFVHGSIIANPGVPAWWPAFCLSYDLVLAGLIAVFLRRRMSPVIP